VSRPKVVEVVDLALTEEEITDRRLAQEREAKEKNRLKGNQLAQALAEALAVQRLGGGKKPDAKK